MGKRVNLGRLELQDRMGPLDQRGNLENKEKREMLETVAPKVTQEKRVILDHLLRESRENPENLVAQGRRVNQGFLGFLDFRGSRENQVSLVLKGNQAYRGYQGQKANVGRQDPQEEGSEGSPESQGQRGSKVNRELEAQRGQRVTVETKGTLELWD